MPRPRRRPGRRARDRRRAQRHRDARLGRPRGRDGPGAARGEGRCRPRRGTGGGRRRGRGAAPVVPVTEVPRVRLVATDLDGTLVHSDGSVTPRTREALLAAEAAGIEVVFVTGRPLRWAEEVFDHVGDHGLAIVSNGALVWDVAAGAPHLQRPIEPAVGLEIAQRIRDAVPGSTFAVETLAGIALESAFLERHPVP